MLAEDSFGNVADFAGEFEELFAYDHTFYTRRSEVLDKPQRPCCTAAIALAYRRQGRVGAYVHYRSRPKPFSTREFSWERVTQRGYPLKMSA